MKRVFSWIRRLCGLAGEADVRQVLEGIEQLKNQLEAQQTALRTVSAAMTGLTADQTELRQDMNTIDWALERIRQAQDEGVEQLGRVSKETREAVRKRFDAHLESERHLLMPLSAGIKHTTRALEQIREQTEALAREMNENQTTVLNLIITATRSLDVSLGDGHVQLKETARQSQQRDEALLRTLQATWLVDPGNRSDQETAGT